jgi:hypothetical protein
MAGKDQHRGMTPEEVNGRKKTHFLRVLLENGGFKDQAIRTCRTSRRWFNEQLDADEEFRLAVETIVDITNEQLVVEARRRAVGYEEPIVYQGKIQGHYVDKKGEIVGFDHPEAKLVPATITKASDNLLMFLIKGRMPEYRDGPGAKKGIEIPDDELNAAIQRYLAGKAKKGNGPVDVGEPTEAVS